MGIVVVFTRGLFALLSIAFQVEYLSVNLLLELLKVHLNRDGTEKRHLKNLHTTKHLFADVIRVHDRITTHVRAIELISCVVIFLVMRPWLIYISKISGFFSQRTKFTCRWYLCSLSALGECKMWFKIVFGSHAFNITTPSSAEAWTQQPGMKFVYLRYHVQALVFKKPPQTRYQKEVIKCRFWYD